MGVATQKLPQFEAEFRDIGQSGLSIRPGKCQDLAHAKEGDTMKKTFLLCALTVPVSGCFTPDPAVSVGQANGKALFQTKCSVHLGAVGRKAVIGPNRGTIVSDYYSCEPQARVTCPNGFTVTKKDKGRVERKTETIVNGPYRTRQTFYVQDVTIQYTCSA